MLVYPITSYWWVVLHILWCEWTWAMIIWTWGIETLCTATLWLDLIIIRLKWVHGLQWRQTLLLGQILIELCLEWIELLTILCRVWNQFGPCDCLLLLYFEFRVIISRFSLFIFVELLKFLVDFFEENFHLVASIVVLVLVFGADAQIKWIVAFYLLRSFFETWALASKSQFDNLVGVDAWIEVSTAVLNYSLHVGTFGANYSPCNLEFFLVFDLDVVTTGILDSLVLIIRLISARIGIKWLHFRRHWSLAEHLLLLIEHSLELWLVYLVLSLHCWHKWLCREEILRFFTFSLFLFILDLCRLNSLLLLFTFLNLKLNGELCLIPRQLNVVEIHFSTKCVEKVCKSHVCDTRLVLYFKLGNLTIILKYL